MSIITVGISDLAVSKSPDVIVTYALGSCVGICLYDNRVCIGGLAHIMLPSSKDVSVATDNYKKYADTGIQLLLKELKIAGANMGNLTAKIAGGAQMFASSKIMSIGDRNVKAVKETLNNYNIKIIAEQTGKNFGRTVYFDTSTGNVEVKSAIKGSIII